MIRHSLRALFAVLLLAVFVPCLRAQEVGDQPVANARLSPEEMQAYAARVSAEMDAVERSAELVRERDEDLARHRDTLEGTIADAQRRADELRPRLDAVLSQSAKLGPAPAKDASPEATQIAQERSRLNALAGDTDGSIKTTELVEERARQLLSRVQQLRNDLYTRTLFRRAQSPVRPQLWSQVISAVPDAVRQVRTIGREWWSALKLQAGGLTGLAGVLVLAAAVYAGLAGLIQRLLARHLDRERVTPPGYFERAGTAGAVVLMRAVAPLATALTLYLGFDSLKLLYAQVERLAIAALIGFLIFTIVRALADAILQPRRTAWRLVEVSDRTAKRLATTVGLIGAVYAIDYLLKDLIQTLSLPLSVSIAESFIANIAFAALLLRLVRTPFEPLALAQAPGAAISRFHPRSVKMPLALIAVLIVIASLFGYVALGQFVAGQVVVTGSAIILLLLLHLAIKAVVNALETGWNAAPEWLRDEQFGIDETQRRQIVRLAGLTLDVGLALLSVPLILLSWGFSFADTTSWIKALLFGFEIGQFRVSLARILFSILLFAALYFATRLMQRWLKGTVLAPTRMDAGIANSIHTGVGYAGIALATLVAISYGGLDITNLAIVAGALSVGIGFGLQSIVNNFVSGLILLVERPIKVGDWIVVKENEGYVRRISVRSTELETFDKASVIVPNSDLIQHAVKNWTHRNSLGRTTLVFKTATSADPDQVREVLLKVAEDCPSVLRHPAPAVSFDQFSAGTLEFSLKAVVPDINRAGAVESELRTAVFKAFRAAGIAV